MRSNLLGEWQHALNRPKARIQRSGFRGVASCGWALFGIVVALGTQAAAPQSAMATTPQTQLAFANIDPGPRPKREDYSTDAEYWLAYLRWLYAVNGGDPSKLDKANVSEAAGIVISLYALTGWQVDESRHPRGEVLAAAAEMLMFAENDQTVFTIKERSLLKETALTVQAAALSTQ